MKEKKTITVQEIVDEYKDLIEDIKASNYYSQDYEIAYLILAAITAGVDRNRPDLIGEVISRFYSTRDYDNVVDKSTIEEMIRIVNDDKSLTEDHQFGRNDPSVTDYVGDALEEYEDLYKPHNR